MDKIAVLDFGGQYTSLIESRLRKMGFYAEILNSDIPLETLRYYKGIILSGGPDCVNSPTAPAYDMRLYSLGIPVLGICYGAQLIARDFGGTVRESARREYGRGVITIRRHNHLLDGLDPQEQVWLSHGDVVESVGEGFSVLATTEAGITAAFSYPERGIYATQFHPEVTHTEKGERILSNFMSVCGASADWTEQDFEQMARERIRREVGERPVIALYSGGGDSFFAVYIARRELLGDLVIPVNIDNGLMRMAEQQKIWTRTGESLGNVRYVDKSDYFFERLRGVVDPEQKRGIIGDAFLESIDPIITELGLSPDTKVIQGTLLTDLVESGITGRRTVTIKTHHNVNSPLALEFRRQGRFVEPNDTLNKDDLRRFAKQLGIPDELFRRDPFPGPGLVVRIVGSDGTYDEDSVEAAYQVARDVGRRFGFDGYASPAQTVGVGGDHRTYAPLVLFAGERDFGNAAAAVREVTSQGGNRGAFVLAHEGELSQERFRRISPLYVDRVSADLAREMDHLAHSLLEEYPEARRVVNQMPVPIFAGDEKPWVGIRPVCTEDYRTASVPRPPQLPEEFLDRFADGAMRTGKIGGVVFDVSEKPPATIEWE